jgi:peptidoglycan/xylan/chitin deacetylase (PgdA/CDA1 family)
MIALTIDLEDWYHIPSVTGSPFSKFKDIDEFFRKWEGRYDYLTQPTMRVLNLLDVYDLKATFFVVADVTEHYPGLVEQISGRGHEIACHGLHHACKINPATKESLMTQEDFEERTVKAKEILEKASGQEVVGYRAPSGYVAGWMLDSLEKLGFRYDSSVSVNSLYNKTDSSLKGVGTQPYYPRKVSLEPGEKRDLLELPWPYFSFGLKLPTAGGPMLRFFGAKYIELGLRQSLRRGDTLVYFHPIDISEESFPTKFTRRRPFYWAIKGKSVEKRLKYLIFRLHDQVSTCRQITLKN